MTNPTPDPNTQPDNPLSTETPPEPNGGKSEPMFTQAELEKHISDRLKRDREAQQNKWLESLGVQSADELKTMLEAKRKADEAQMSELDKLNAQLETERKARQDALNQVAQMKAEQLANGRKASLLDAIRANGGSDEGQLYILVNAEMKAAFESVFADGDTTVDDNKMKAFIKDVQGKFPRYFGTAGAGSPSSPLGTPLNANPTEEMERMTKKFGKI